jgi:hypothetical protein
VPWSKENIKTGTTRVYDCIAIADGKKTLAEVRAQHAHKISPSAGKKPLLLSPQRKTSCGRHLIFSPGGKLA